MPSLEDPIEEPWMPRPSSGAAVPSRGGVPTGSAPGRWAALFADLEAQLAAEERLDLAAEVADRTRRERALVGFGDRLGAMLEHEIRLDLVSGSLVGRLADLGSDWLLVQEGHSPTAARIVPWAAVVGVRSASLRARQQRSARRFGLGSALRVLARDRATVIVTDRAGVVSTGTIDGVGSDCFDLSEHALGEWRRDRNLTGTRLIPFGALLHVGAPGSTSLA